VTRELVMERDFHAPRTLVWENWTRAEHVQDWFAPTTFEVVACEFDARPGAKWRVEYRTPDGATFVERGEFVEVVEPERLVFTLVQEFGTPGPELRVTVQFSETGKTTHMAFRQVGFASDEERDGNADGWAGCILQLEARLAPQVAKLAP
jgi:uncharacterized protein YndB with AHSA1/START domain